MAQPELMRAELSVIGEVLGRWQTFAANEWEREATDAVLHQIARRP
jgi:hypothetical protein